MPLTITTSAAPVFIQKSDAGLQRLLIDFAMFAMVCYHEIEICLRLYSPPPMIRWPGLVGLILVLGSGVSRLSIGSHHQSWVSINHAP